MNKKEILAEIFTQEPVLKAGGPISMVTSMVFAGELYFNTRGVEENQTNKYSSLKSTLYSFNNSINSSLNDITL